MSEAEAPPRAGLKSVSSPRVNTTKLKYQQITVLNEAEALANLKELKYTDPVNFFTETGKYLFTAELFTSTKYNISRLGPK